LVPALIDPAATPRDSALTQYSSGYSIRTRRYRYIAWGPNGREGSELYDHQSDPDEMKNLAGRPEVESVEAELSQLWRKRVEEAHQVPTGLKQRKRK